MKKIFTTTGCIVAGLFVGIVSEQKLAPARHRQGGGAEAAAPGKSLPREDAAGSRTGARARKLPSHDFATLLKWRLLQDSGDPEQLREVERMDSAELKALLVDFGARLKQAGQEAGPMSRAIELAARELYQREGEAALVWASAQGSGRQAVLSTMISVAAFNDPVLALPWIDRFQAEFGGSCMNTMANEAVKGATSRGADDLLKLRELYGDRLKRVAFPSGPFPEDFDFGRFVAAMKGDAPLHSTVQHWASKDKEAAWLGIKASIGDGVGRLGGIGSVFAGVAMVDGDRRAAEWLLPRLAELPAEKRPEAIRALRGQGGLAPESLQAIMPLLRSDEERIILATASISPWSASGAAALQCLSSDELREEALISVAGAYGPAMKTMAPTQREKATKSFTTMMDELEFPDDRRERVMKALLPDME